MDKFPATIKAVTTIQQDGESEIFELMADGTVAYLDKTVVVSYEEVLNGQATQVIVKIKPDESLDITRKNVVKTRLDFALNRLIDNDYPTQAGILALTTKAQIIDFGASVDQTIGQLKLVYQLLANHRVVGDYEFVLQFSGK